MAGNSISPSPPSKLPEELLVAILDHIYSAEIFKESQIPGPDWRYGDGVDDLKSLRLASREYAYLPTLLTHLFASFRLLSTREHVRVQQTNDISGIKPYVRRIIFKYGLQVNARAFNFWKLPVATVQAAWTNVLRQLTHVGAFLITEVSELDIDIAFSGLGATKPPIRSLHINCTDDGNFEWADDGLFNSLDLENMHTLVWHPFYSMS